MRPGLPVLWTWAARDLLRRPGEALLAAAALSSLAIVCTTLLLFAGGVEATTRRVLEEAPDLVVRRVDAGGWAPMPESALARARSVRGVTLARARHWGPARVRGRTVTIVGASAELPAPRPGRALLGPGLTWQAGEMIEVDAARRRSFEVEGTLPPSVGIVAHDLIVVTTADARSLLGLAPGTASDLAVWVFHEGEAAAIGPDLARAIPFPVRFARKGDSFAAETAQVARLAGLRLALLVPALLALALLTAAITRAQLGARRDIGLMKALGWGTREIVRLHLCRALIIGAPAFAASWGIAYALVFVWRAPWMSGLIFGWTGPAPRLTLDPGGAIAILSEVTAFLGAPWLVGMVLPALRIATAEPEQWLHGEEP